MAVSSPDSVLDHPSVRRVAEQLAVFGVRGQVTPLAESARTARDAARALGIDVAQIANSLVFRAHHGNGSIHPLLILTSGVHRVDLVKVADLLGMPQLSRADAGFVLAHTGFVIGGVAPIAHRSPVPAVVDVSLSRYAQIWAAAGHPNAVFPTSYDELLRITGGQPAEVA